MTSVLSQAMVMVPHIPWSFHWTYCTVMLCTLCTGMSSIIYSIICTLVYCTCCTMNQFNNSLNNLYAKQFRGCDGTTCTEIVQWITVLPDFRCACYRCTQSRGAWYKSRVWLICLRLITPAPSTGFFQWTCNKMAPKTNKLAFLSMPAPASYVAGLGRGWV